MNLPSATSSYQTRTRYGRYVARRLRRDKRTTMAEDALAVTKAVRETGRAWDDADDAIQDALADRDAADDALDAAAQEARHALAGRSVQAVNEAPYTDIIPEGISYYTAAPLDQQVQRYTELTERLTEHLPPTDEVRQKTVNAVTTGLTDFQAAVKSLEAARTADALAATRLAKATDAWTRQMEKIYGALVAEIGRAAAERFFPRAPRKAATAKGKSEPQPQ